MFSVGSIGAIGRGYRSTADPLYAIAGSTPSLDLNFARTRSLVDVVTGNNLITFTRASEKTIEGLVSPIEVPPGTPAFAINPFNGESIGLWQEPGAVQILELTDALATQTKTVTATAHTLSFYGTGTIVLSGAHSATVVGIGAYPSRTTLTFTPTAGNLTLTVTGSVRFGQLETGNVATSYIRNAGTSQVTRSVDLADVTGSNFSSWYRQDEMTIYVEVTNYDKFTGGNRFPYVLQIDDGTNSNRASFDHSVLSGGYRCQVPVLANGVFQAGIGPFGILQNSVKWVARIKTDDFAAAVSTAPTIVNTDVSGVLPSSMIQMLIGRGLGLNYNGIIKRIVCWRQGLPNSTLLRLIA